MLLTISTTHRPATDLGQLLHHHIDGIGMAALPFGHAMVCYSQADEARCTAAVMLDAPHPSPSQLGVALAEVFGRALHGRSDTRPELARRILPFEVALPVLPSRGGAALVRRLFEPLGYRVTVDPVPFDAPVPDEHAPGELAVHLAADVRAADLLSHLCVLLPVLDETHMGVGDEAPLDWLLVEGDDWLGPHPALACIARRYAGHHWPRRRQCSRTA
jgi:RNA repair, ligase-Pnkp-associating, region of Hen1